MTGVEIAGLLKDYGLVGAVALLLYALKVVVGRWRDCMQERLNDNKAITERMATALERQAATNADIAENMKELRDGQGEIQKVATEAALTAAAGRRETNAKLSDLKTGQDRQPSGAAK
ncbi:hypothetical protein [Methylobacterium sp. GC_Met_2]|uniref:hypothetical protein n=1 Tax=Methylobacterium sp. GC_Met_2 TaxID=2937376 RepID=UPI00226B3945|nr:hypothetical protein [Methylobacterium sp. GC_Met_2]